MFSSHPSSKLLTKPGQIEWRAIIGNRHLYIPDPTCSLCAVYKAPTSPALFFSTLDFLSSSPSEDALPLHEGL